jgi:hypothetical protein
MAGMLSGGPAAECGERAFQSSMEMMLSRLSEVELEHPPPPPSEFRCSLGFPVFSRLVGPPCLARRPVRPGPAENIRTEYTSDTYAALIQVRDVFNHRREHAHRVGAALGQPKASGGWRGGGASPPAPPPPPPSPPGLAHALDTVSGPRAQGQRGARPGSRMPPLFARSCLAARNV